MPRLRIAALGSSFAAGPGIEPIIDKDAMRSGRNYAHQLAQKLDADLTDLTVSGATLLSVLNEPQVPPMSKKTFPPQLEGLPADTDIVTLTAGGNDLGYASGLMYDSMMAWIGPLQWLLRWYWVHPSNGVEASEVTARFVAVIDKIKEIASNAKIYLVQYLTVFGDHAEPGKGNVLTSEHIATYKGVADRLAEATAEAANGRPGVEVVPIASMGQQHGVGAPETWIGGFSLTTLWQRQVPFHPNLAGHTAVAERLFKQVQAGQEPLK